MESAIKALSLLGIVFLVEFIVYNFLYPNRLPKIPGDLDIRRGIRIYIPFVSALALSVAITIFYFNFFR